MLIATAILLCAVYLSGTSSETIYFGEEGPASEFGAGLLAEYTIGFVVMFVTVLWIAVAWHRYVLLEEYPSGFLPPVNADRILAYFGRFALIFLILVLCSVPPVLLVANLGDRVPSIAALLVAILYLFLATALMRLSIALPATAIGQPVTFSEAWEQTRGKNSAILLLLLAMFAFQFIVQLMIGVFSLLPVLGGLLAIFAGFILIPIINLSVLTTMYGVFIQKRQLT